MPPWANDLLLAGIPPVALMLGLLLFGVGVFVPKALR